MAHPKRFELQIRSLEPQNHREVGFGPLALFSPQASHFRSAAMNSGRAD
jgi:hypothetical protein